MKILSRVPRLLHVDRHGNAHRGISENFNQERANNVNIRGFLCRKQSRHHGGVEGRGDKSPLVLGLGGCKGLVAIRYTDCAIPAPQQLNIPKSKYS
jgi:hypothetical protein